MKTKVAIFISIVCMFIASCGDYSNEIHIDETKKAIVACNANILKEVIIETPEVNVTYEGVDTIYFNKINSASRITVGLDVENNYVLRLKPNSTYDINSYSGNGDQGPDRIVLKTDDKGNIIHDIENSCQ